MYVFISFYEHVLTGEIKRKQIHVVDNPKVMFDTMNKAIEDTKGWFMRSEPDRHYPIWTFYAYQVDCDPQYLYALYRGFWNADKPARIDDNVLTYYVAHTVHHSRLLYCLSQD